MLNRCPQEIQRDLIRGQAMVFLQLRVRAVRHAMLRDGRDHPGGVRLARQLAVRAVLGRPTGKLCARRLCRVFFCDRRRSPLGFRVPVLDAERVRFGSDLLREGVALQPRNRVETLPDLRKPYG